MQRQQPGYIEDTFDCPIDDTCTTEEDLTLKKRRYHFREHYINVETLQDSLENVIKIMDELNSKLN